MIRTFAPLCAATALALALSIHPSEARGHGGHHGHDRGRHHRHGPHGGHGGGWHGGHWRHGGWRGPRPVPRGVFWRGGGPTVVVGGGPAYDGWRGPRRVYAGGYGPGCSTTRRVSWTPWGLRKVVTTKTCYLP